MEFTVGSAIRVIGIKKNSPQNNEWTVEDIVEFFDTTKEIIEKVLNEPDTAKP